MNRGRTDVGLTWRRPAADAVNRVRHDRIDRRAAERPSEVDRQWRRRAVAEQTTAIKRGVFFAFRVTVERMKLMPRARARAVDASANANCYCDRGGGGRNGPFIVCASGKQRRLALLGYERNFELSSRKLAATSRRRRVNARRREHNTIAGGAACRL